MGGCTSFQHTGITTLSHGLAVGLAPAITVAYALHGLRITFRPITSLCFLSRGGGGVLWGLRLRRLECLAQPDWCTGSNNSINRFLCRTVRLPTIRTYCYHSRSKWRPQLVCGQWRFQSRVSSSDFHFPCTLERRSLASLLTKVGQEGVNAGKA